MTEQTGMTEDELRHWNERDPKYLANQITDRELLRLSRPGGFYTTLSKNPDLSEAEREEYRRRAELEASYLVFNPRATYFDRAWYDTRVGFGQVGTFGLNAAAGTARFFADFSDRRGAREWWTSAADRLGEYAADKEARWLGPAIDTGNPVSDFIRTSIFQGTPMLGTFVGISLIPGVGVAGSAGLMGWGMGGGTYKTLRDDGISPELSALAAGGTGLVSYFTSKFTLDNLARYLGGRSPFKLFSVGTALEVSHEAGQELVENTAQATFEGMARLIGDKDATAAQEWRRWKDGFKNAFTEAGMAGVTTLGFRLLGFPVAMRNGMRAHVFTNTFKKSGDLIVQSEQFAKAPDILAAQLTEMAAHNGGGPVFTSVAEMTQAGVTRDQAVAPVAEGGLGLDAAKYDQAEVTGEDIPVGYGEALVFSQKQKMAGNAKAVDVFAADPDSMSVGQIKAMEAEADAIATESEAYFTSLQAGDDSKSPLRIKIFRSGLRASGRYDTHQADALAAMFWRGAERSAERWGMSVDEWLERQDVQLEMKSLMGKAGDIKRYHAYIEESRARHDAALSDSPESADSAATATVAADTAAPVDGAAQPDVAVPDTVADTVAALAPDLPVEQQAEIVEQAKEIIAAGADLPEVAALAEQIGVSPAPQPAAQQKPKGAGRRTKIIFPAESGTPAMAARYQLVEMSSLQPSHTFRNYTPSPAWTAEELAQQRNYDSGAMEAVRLGIEMDRLNFDAVFNPATDAINGPPTITADGKVMGGNNRTHRIYNRYETDGYRDKLVSFLDSEENLTRIDPADAVQMEKPVLVRVLEDVTPEAIPGLIGALNADFTNRRDPANLSANRGMRVGAKTLSAFSGINDQTIAAYLDNPATARRVLQAMVEDGALQNTDLPSLYDFQYDKWLGDGRSNGKARVEQALFGAILPDSRLLDSLSDGMKKKLVRALPGLIRLKRNNSPELSNLIEAVRYHNDYQAFKGSPTVKGLKPAAILEEFRQPTQRDMFTGQTGEVKSGPAWDMFLELRAMKTQREVADFFTRKADELAGIGRGLFDLSQSAIGELYQDSASPEMQAFRAVVATHGADGFTLVNAAEAKRRLAALEAMDAVPIRNALVGNDNVQELRELAHSIYDGLPVASNEHDGRSLNFPQSGFRKIRAHSADPRIMQAVPDLRAIFARAIPIYQEAPRDRNDMIRAWRNYAAKVAFDGQPVYIRLTAKEMRNGDLELDFYDIHYTEMNEGSQSPVSEANRPRRKANPDNDILSHWIDVVNKSDDTTPGELHQGDSLNSPRGAIRFPQTKIAPTLIRLFENADVSTVVHELNHLFVADLERLVLSGQGGERAAADWAALVAFTDGGLESKNADEKRDAYEKIASAWERYAVEGVAPANSLVDAFDLFRTYIARIYRHAVEQELIEPSPEVRRVFDAFLATDEEIAAAKRRRDVAEDWSRTDGTSDAARNAMNAINARRDARRRARRDARQGGGRQMRGVSQFDAIRKVVRGEMEADPTFRALDWARAQGGMDRATAVAAVGEAAVASIEEKHGKNVFAVDGVAAEKVAVNAGYDTDVVGMLAAMAEAENIDSQAETEAKRRSEIYEAEDVFANNDQEASEGVDEETADPFSAGDMTDSQQLDADTLDMIEEVGVAIKEEARANDSEHSLFKAAARLRDWQDAQAVLRRKARAEVFAKTVRNGGVDIRSYRTARNRARRNAFAAAERQDRKAVVRWKKQELYHHYQIVFAKQARALRERILKQYSAHGLKATIDAKEHHARLEQQYATALAQVAMYAGMAESRFLRQMAGDTAKSPVLALPQESGDLGGLVENIADTLPDWLLTMQHPKNFKDFRDFTIEQLFEIDRLMRWLIDTGHGKLSSMLSAEAETLNELAGTTTAPMKRRKKLESTGGKDARTHWNRVLNGIKRFGISITIPENWFMAMDGNPTIQGKEMGPNQRLFRHMVNADVRKQMLYESRIAAMQPHFDTLNLERKAWEKRVGGRFATIRDLPVPKILKRGRDIATWDFDLLLSVALNMGNDANLRRLLTDEEFAIRFKKKFDEPQDFSIPRYNFTNAQLAKVAEQFSADAWHAIQGLLDGMNDMYADSDKVTFNLTNRHVVKEAAISHLVQTSDGQIISLRGGYFPLVNDPMLSARSAELNEKTSIEDQIWTGLLNNIHGATKRSPGAIKERARGEDGTPLVTLPQILSTDIIPRHIETMAHYIAYAELLRDMDRLTRHDAWKGEYIDKFGQEQYDAVRTWLKNLAAPERGADSPGERFMVWMRSLATINALGLRWSTGNKQRLGAFQAAAFMTDNSRTKSSGWKWLGAGIAEMGVKGNLGIQNAKVEFVNQKSKFMRARSGGFDREIRAMRSRFSPLHREVRGYSLADVQNAMFFWIQANDVAMANATWLGAYRQALAGEANFDTKKIRSDMLAEGRTEDEVNIKIDKRAVDFADTAAATQASSFAPDLTEVQRDRGFMRFMSMFMSGNMRQGSRFMQYIDAYHMGDKTKGDVAWLAVREFVFPSLAWVFLRAAFLFAAAEAFGIGGDDDDLWKEAFWETIDTAAAPFPLVREIPRIFQYGSLAGDVTAVKSSARAATNAFGSVSSLAEGEYTLAVGKAIDAAGFAFGIPIMNPLNEFGIAEMVGLKKGRRKK
ncbi:MAG: hypothetical protein LUG50_11625 [Planctomycetaceae bacterium]|nr:hypothetical protein [Planctomycetaceae bacterium]